MEAYVTSIPDFPEPGIIFRDVTTILEDPDGLHLAIDELQDLLKDVDFDVLVGAEARGFIFGMPIAYNLNKPFVPVRKKGKLPREAISQSYERYIGFYYHAHLELLSKLARIAYPAPCNYVDILTAQSCHLTEMWCYYALAFSFTQ